MTPERWRQVEGLLQRALACDAAARGALLDQACAGDPALRDEVESLLATAGQTQGFLASGAAEDAAVLFDEQQPDPLVGAELGPYLIERSLGSGGMGQVYLAHDSRLGRKVALKLLDPDLSADQRWRTRFLREARLASVLDHPNVCTVHEVGEADGRAFIAMQYVEGMSLREAIDGRPLPLDRSLSLALQVADALAAAHERGIVHRDVKTANVMITPRGQAKVLDFGIAKLLDEAGPADTQVTATGSVLGTPASMSPEQACGDRVDHRSDIFSFGVVLYEMATGRGPFERNSRAEAMGALLKEAQTPAQDANQAVPTPLSDLIDRAMAKEPAGRYQSMHDLIAELRQVASGSATGSGARPIVQARSPLSSLSRRPKRVALGTLAATAIMAALTVALLRSPKEPPPIRSLAVLPFKPLIGGQADEALELGMADTLITRLGNIRQIRLRPITAVRKYARPEQDAVQAGREQRVDAVLDGHIQKEGEMVRVSVRLVRVADETPLWADRFDAPMAGIFAVQDSISERVAAALAIHLIGEEKERLTKRHTENAEAYQLYLKGRYHLNRLTDDGFRKGRDHFEQAIGKDPNYALAHAGLADSYNMLSGWNALAPKEGFPRARTAAMKALDLDDSLAEAHTALGTVKLFYEWDWPIAEKELRRAVEINPSHADGHQMYSYYLAARGRFPEAFVEIERALALDPLSLVKTAGIADIFYFQRQYDRAIEQYQKALEMDPNSGFAHWALGRALTAKGMYDEAIASFQKAIPLSGDSPDEPAELGRTYALAGRRREAFEIVGELKRQSERRYVAPALIATIYAALGDKDQAFAWLDRAHAERDFLLIFLAVEPMFDPIRSDPRFADLLRRVGLP